MFARYVVWVTVAVAMLAPSSLAQNRRPQARSGPLAGASGKTLCVDVVTLRQGKPAKGLIVRSQDDQLLMAVERDVLSHDNAELYRKAAEAERTEAVQAWTQLRDRLRLELDAQQSQAEAAGAAAPKPPQLSIAMRNLLERELARAEKQLGALSDQPDVPLDTRFVWLELGAREIQSVKRATPQAQRVAVWAWSEGLANVSARDVIDVQQELTDEKINFQLQPPDLSHLLAPRQQSADQWATRLAIVRYALDAPLDFQGSNGVFVKTGDGTQAADLGPLIQKMMGGNLEALLADLDPTKGKRSSSSSSHEWIESITPQAEQLQHTQFRVTRLENDPNGEAATVETAFVVKLPASGWQIAWSARHTTRASEVNADAEQQIAEDPQVKTVLGLLSALGAGAEAEVKKAIRFGAATMAAQKAAEAEFFRFRDRYVQRLDGPPL